MLLLLMVTSITAQTFDLGEGKTAVINGDSYKMTWNNKSINGGTVRGTLSGNLKDGKRNGLWRVTLTYNKFGSDQQNFATGTINISRTYSNGLPNGSYSYISTLTWCKGSQNWQTKQWHYGASESAAENITGSFTNGKANGKWSISSQRFKEKITMQYDNGKAIGEWTIADNMAQTWGFKDGYLVKSKEMNADGWGTELSYSPEEILEQLPNQDTVKVINAIPYSEYYMKGAMFADWFRQYPNGSSDDDITAYYILADYDNHLKYIGNIPDWKKDEIERKKTSKIVEAKKIEDQQYATLIQDSLKAYLETIALNKRNFAKIIGNDNLYACQFMSEFIKRHPKYKEFAFTRFNEQWSINKTRDLLRMYTEIHTYDQELRYYNERVTKILAEVKAKQVPGSDEEILNKAYDLYSDKAKWSRLLNESYSTYLYENTEVTENDICAYLCYKYVIYDITFKKYKVIAKDASTITMTDVKDFVFENDGNYEKVTKYFENDSGSTRLDIPLTEIMEAVRNTGKFKKLLETVQR